MNQNDKQEEKISVIIPIYNVENYLERCLDTVINQTYKMLEIILVDDGSKDSSGKICDAYADKDERIVVIHKENGGLSDARNVGIKKASGKYIALIDSDDFIDKKMLEILIKNLKETKADISICAYKLFYNDKVKIIQNSKENIKYTIYNKREALKQLLSADDTKITNHAWNKLYKKELFNKIYYPKGRNFEDIGTTYKLFDKSNLIVYTNYIGYYYYQRDNSITGNINLKSIKDSMYLIKQRYKFLIEEYPDFEDILFRNRANFALLHITGLAKTNNKEECNSFDAIQEYNIFKEYIRENGMKNIIIDNSRTYGFFAVLLFLNRKIFYYIISNLFNLKRGLKQWKK